MPPTLPPPGFRHLADAVLLNRAVYGGADDMAAGFLSDYGAARDPDAVGNRAALNVYDRYGAYLAGFGFRTLSSAELGFPAASVSASELTDGLDHDFTYRGGLFRNNFQKLPAGLEVPFTGAGAVALATVKEAGGTKTLHLAFRGTDADFGLDGEAATGPGQVRYYRQLEGLIDRVYDFVAKAANGIGEVVVSGHSLGGAMADLFALYDGARFAALGNAKLSVVSLASAGVDPATLALRPDYDKSLVTVDAAGIRFRTPDWYASYDQAGDIVRNPATYDAAAHAKAEPDQAPVTGFVITLLREHLHFEGNRISVETPLIDQYKVSAPLATNFLALHYASLYELIGGALAEASDFVDDIGAYARIVALNGLNPESLKTPGTNDASGFGVPVNDRFSAAGDSRGVAVLALGGDDTVATGAGRDFLLGGTGRDDLSGAAGGDILVGGEGDDRLFGGDGIDRLFGGQGSDRLSGGAGRDWLAGGTGDDVLCGWQGQDSLAGGAGADLLSGHAGNDVLDGGAGRDTARYGGSAAGYGIERRDGLVTIADLDRSDGDDGRDTLRNIEEIRFNSGDLLIV